MIIRREVFSAVLPATTLDETRYGLDNVQIRPDGTVCATNGHMAIFAKDRNPIAPEDFPIVPGVPDGQHEPTAPILVPIVTVQRAVASTAKKPILPVLGAIQITANGTPGAAVLAATDLTVPVVLSVDSTGQSFPDLDRIKIADDEKVIRLTLSVDMLKDILKSAQAAIGKAKHNHGGMVRFEIPTADRWYVRQPFPDPQPETETTAETATAAEPTPEPTYKDLVDRLRVCVRGDDADVTMIVMPCRP